MGKFLTDQDICRAAKEIGCGTSIMKAVADIESSGHGFLDDGRIKIRFEGHKFRSYTAGKYDQSHPEVSYPYRVQGTKRHGYNEFSIAFGLDPTAAMLATSWGAFQPMGFTHDEAGFDNVNEFVDFLKVSEGNQLIAFVRLVKHRGLDDELRRGTLADCATFARLYNGKDYKVNQYDTKIYNRKRHYDANPIRCNETFTDIEDGNFLDIPQVSADSSPSTPATPPAVVDAPPTGTTVSSSPDLPTDLPGTTQVADTIVNSGDVAPATPAPVDQVIAPPVSTGTTAQATKVTIGGLVVPPTIVAIWNIVDSLMNRGFLTAQQISDTVIKFMTSNTKYFLLLLGVFLGFLMLKRIERLIIYVVSMITHAMPTWNSVIVQPTETPKKKWWQIF